MVCGEEEAVLAAEETQRCLYDLTLATPAACQALLLSDREGGREAGEGERRERERAPGPAGPGRQTRAPPAPPAAAPQP